MVVLLVALEMLGEIGDALGEEGNLDFGRTGVAFLGAVFLEEFRLALSRNRHRVPFCFR